MGQTMCFLRGNGVCTLGAWWASRKEIFVNISVTLRTGAGLSKRYPDDGVSTSQPLFETGGRVSETGREGYPLISRGPVVEKQLWA